MYKRKRSTYIFFSWMAASAWPRSPTHEANARKIHVVWQRKQQISTASLGTQSKEEAALINMLHPPNTVVRVLRQTSTSWIRDGNLWSVFHNLVSVLAACGLSSTIWTRNGKLWSVFHYLDQEWQPVVCLQLFGPRMATCGLSSTVWSRDGNLWSVFNCLEQGWQPMDCLPLFGSGMATCGLSSPVWSREVICHLSSTVWSKDGNMSSVFHCLEQGWQTEVCFPLSGAGTAVYYLYSIVWSWDGSLWSVFYCLEQE